MIHRTILWAVWLMLLTILTIGCGPSPEATRIAREAADRQAEQNEQMAKLNQEMARNSQRVIEADAESRREVLEVQQNLIARDAEGRSELNSLQQETQDAVTEQQARIDQKYEALDSERREIAAHRHRDPIIAATLQGLMLTMACLVPILLAAYLLYSLNHDETPDAQLAELLVREIASESGTLLGPLGPAPTCLSREKQRLKLSVSEVDEPDENKGSSGT
jgi:hypothetical protein